MNCVDYISLGISLLALAASIFIYFAHDKKLKEQEVKINVLTLERLQTEKEEANKALVKGEYIPAVNGKMSYIRVGNYGKSIAKNVNMEFENTVRYTSTVNVFPYQLLNSGDCIDFYLQFHERYGTVKVTFIWDDDTRNGNTYTQMLQV